MNRLSPGTATGGGVWGAVGEGSRSCCGRCFFRVDGAIRWRSPACVGSAFHADPGHLDLGRLSCCHLLITWSRSFTRQTYPAPWKGRDLNPMLQHLGLILHPPLLYLGYGGLMTAASALLASLLVGGFSGDAQVCWRWALPGWCAPDAGDHSRIVVGVLRTGLRAAGGSARDPVEMSFRCCRGFAASACTICLCRPLSSEGFRRTIVCCWRYPGAITLVALGTLIVRSGISCFSTCLCAG